MKSRCSHYVLFGVVLAAAALPLRAAQEKGAEMPLLKPAGGVDHALQVLPPLIPRSVPVAVAPDFQLENALPIDLPTALRLAQGANLDIGQARQTVDQAQALLAAARSTFLPNFNIGDIWSHHEGNIAKTEGNIIKANKNALFVGGGPSLTMSFADALFAPLAARQVRDASRAGLRRVANVTLQAVADAYFEVLRARRRLARTGETLDFLVSERASPRRADSRGLLPVIKAFVEGGVAEALRSELERVRVEVSRREEERAGALQDFRVATAELGRLLRIDPQWPLVPVEDFRIPMPLPADRWTEYTVEQLLEVALANRPELAENRALVQVALDRVRQAKWRPWTPNLALTYNWGEFGGGPDPNPPIIKPPAKPGGAPTIVTQPGFGSSGIWRHFNTRTDLDLSLFWRFQNLGFGDAAAVRANQALYRQAELRRIQVYERVVTEVIQAQESVRGWRERLQILSRSLFDEKGDPTGPVFQSLRLNFERIRNVPGSRPLEVLDSIRGLNDLLEAYGQAATEYERARFRLMTALGVPDQGLFAPAPAPSPP
jgi:outer membrane protein TolC